MLVQYTCIINELGFDKTLSNDFLQVLLTLLLCMLGGGGGGGALRLAEYEYPRIIKEGLKLSHCQAKVLL